MTLATAGDDVTEFLALLLGRISFPYKELDLARLHDWALMEDIKCRIVTLNEVRCHDTLQRHFSIFITYRVMLL